jgi:hypothetical protein
MPIPNLNTSDSRVEGKLAVTALTTSAQTILSVGGAETRTVRIRSMFVSNQTINTQTATVNLVRSGVTYPIAFQASVIRNSLYNIASLDDAMYLQPGDSITALAGAASAITLFISYEDCT